MLGYLKAARPRRRHRPPCPVGLAAVMVSLLVAACGGGATRTTSVDTTTTAPPVTKPVSYLGLTIDVPTTWRVGKRSPCAMVGPGVMVGPPPSPVEDSISCPYVPPQGTVMTFGGPDSPVPPFGREHRETINRITVLTSEGVDGTVGSNAIWAESVRFPHRKAWIEIEAPGATQLTTLAPAQVVLATVHADR